MSALNVPNLIIAGAPKCGTTSLFRWLEQHPNVCGAVEKETYFLMDEDSPLYPSGMSYHRNGLQGYGHMFRACPKDTRIWLDATPDYLYQKTALEVLADGLRDTKVVFILRQPADRVFSAYRFYQGHRAVIPADMTFAEFVKVIRTQEAGLRGKLAPLAYASIDHSFYINYLRSWRDMIGFGRIKVLIYEEAVSDPLKTLQALSRWLALDATHFEHMEYGVFNKSYSVRNQGLHSAKMTLARLIPNSRIKNWVGRVYRALNVREEWGSIAEADRAQLCDLDAYFKEGNAALAAEFGVDLGRWSGIEQNRKNVA